MADAGYAYQLDDDYTIELSKKRFSLLGFLSKIRNFCVLFLILIVAYNAWPSIHYDSYLRFRLILGLIFSKEVFELIVNSWIISFKSHPVGRCIELLILAIAI